MEIKEFDVSGTLESAPDGLEATASLGKTTGRGVIQTEEAAEMDEKLKAVMENAMTKEETVSTGPSSRRIGGGVTSSGSSSVSPSEKRNMANISTTKTDVNEDIIEQKSPPVSRRKRVVKKEVVPEIEEDEVPEDTGPRYETREGPSLSDDEEFSDFSF